MAVDRARAERRCPHHAPAAATQHNAAGPGDLAPEVERESEYGRLVADMPRPTANDANDWSAHDHTIPWRGTPDEPRLFDDDARVAERGGPDELQHATIEIVADLARNTTPLSGCEKAVHSRNQCDQEIDRPLASGHVVAVRLAVTVHLGQLNESCDRRRPHRVGEDREDAGQRRKAVRLRARHL